MTSPTLADTSATLASIRALAAIDPKNLEHARDTFSGIQAHATSLRGTAHAALGEQIAAAVAESFRAGESRVRTLPQAKIQLEKIAALLPAAAPAVSQTRSDLRANFLDTIRKGAAERAAKRAELGLPSATSPAATLQQVQAIADTVQSIVTASGAHVELPKPQPTDAEIYAVFESLRGARRAAFIEENRDRLWAEHCRRQRANYARR